MKKHTQVKKTSTPTFKSKPNLNDKMNLTFIRVTGFLVGTFSVLALFQFYSQPVQSPSLSIYQNPSRVLGDSDASKLEDEHSGDSSLENKGSNSESTQNKVVETHSEVITETNTGLKSATETKTTVETEKHREDSAFKPGSSETKKPTSSSKPEVIKNGLKIKHVETDDTLELNQAEVEKHKSELADEIEDEVKIATDDAHKFTLSKGKIGAIGNFPLSLNPEDKTLTVTTPKGTKTVTVLPDKAVLNLIDKGVITNLSEGSELVEDKTGQSKLSNMVELKMRDDKPVYEIDGIKRFNLFSLFPIDRPIKSFVSLETGDVVETDKSIITKLIDLLSP